ncbi:MAG: hypothetical protein WC608_03515 [Parcubacteria group bacterium]
MCEHRFKSIYRSYDGYVYGTEFHEAIEKIVERKMSCKEVDVILKRMKRDHKSLFITVYHVLGGAWIGCCGGYSCHKDKPDTLIEYI